MSFNNERLACTVVGCGRQRFGNDRNQAVAQHYVDIHRERAQPPVRPCNFGTDRRARIHAAVDSKLGQDRQLTSRDRG